MSNVSIWSSARHHHKRISDMHAGSLDPRSLPQQKVRDCQNAAQDQPKKAPRRAEEGPEKGPKGAQDGPEAAQAGFWTTQARASPHWAAALAVLQSKLGRFGAVLGSVLGPKLGRESSKIDPRARLKKVSKYACRKRPQASPKVS